MKDELSERRREEEQMEIKSDEMSMGRRKELMILTGSK